MRAEPGRLSEDRAQRLRTRVRHHATKSQGDTGRGGAQRTDRRHVEDGAVIAHVEQDGGVGRGVFGPRRGRRDRRGDISRPRDLLTTWFRYSTILEPCLPVSPSKTCPTK